MMDQDIQHSVLNSVNSEKPAPVKVEHMFNITSLFKPNWKHNCFSAKPAIVTIKVAST